MQEKEGCKPAGKAQCDEQRKAADERASKRQASADRQQPHTADQRDDLCAAGAEDPAMQVCPLLPAQNVTDRMRAAASRE